jgi:predicted nuclease of predicted toxin-antitoxin system
MSETRFHLDENVDPAIADAPRRRGVDVTTSQQVALLCADDGKQLAYELSQSRVLVTHDDDFLILAQEIAQFAGIAYCHPEVRSIGQIIAFANADS